MTTKIGCFQEIDSMTMQDRLHEVVYTYKAHYKYFTDDFEIPESKLGKEIVCPYCGDTLAIVVQDRRRLLAGQASFLLAFIATLPISLFLFDSAVRAGTGGLWTLAVLFFIFGCFYTGFIAFNIKQYEFEALYKIKNRAMVKTPDGKHSFNKHRTFEEGYEHQFGKAYVVFRVAYASSILLYLFFFYRIVIERENDFNFIFFSLVLLLSISLSLLRLMNYLYDKFWGKTIKFR